MSQRIVFAKTARPRVTGVLERERLFAWLDDACIAPLVWVQAPAGAGKTSLVASYLNARERAAMWYQVDAADADPATFFAYLVRGFGEQFKLPLFTAEYRDDPCAFARHFFRRMAFVRQPFLLVLDNYHELARDAPLHALLQEGARELPSEFSLVVASREAPPAGFARLRANRELRVLDWPQLRLTRDEIRSIVEAAGVTPGDALVDSVAHTTQGWAAALILMLDGGALSVSSTRAVSTQPAGMLFDYLAEEVFDRLPGSVQQVLLRTACVREISDDLAGQVSGVDGAGDQLQALVDEHHLVSVKPGPGGPLFECHPLLREFLQRKAAQELTAADRQRLAMRAASVLECEGSLDAAATLLGGDPRALSGFAIRHAATMLSQGRADTVLAWMDGIAQEVCQSRPWLSYWRGACLFETDPAAAMSAFSDAYRGFDGGPGLDVEGAALSCARAMASLIYARHEFAELDRWIPRALLLMRSSSLASSGEPRQRLLVGLFMALVFRQPHHEAIGELASDSFDACQGIEDTATRTWAQLLIAINLNYTGQFERARLFIDALDSAGDDAHASPLALTTLATVKSMYHMLAPDSEQCLRVVLDGIELGRDTGVQVWSYHLLVNGAAGALGEGDTQAAGELLARLEGLAPGAGHLDRTIYHYLCAWKSMLADDLDDAYRQQKQAVSVALAAGCPLYVALCRLALAQVLMERGDVRGAFGHLRRVRDTCRGIRNRLLSFTVNCVLADIAGRAGRNSLALGCLRSAFTVGREQGFSHFLWWLPRVMGRLCALALDSGVEVDYARALIRSRGLRPPQPVRQRQRWPWQLELRTLGSFELGGARTTSPVPSGRQMQLLKTLAGLGGREIREDHVAHALWPRIPQEHAQRSLATTLHRLRKHLGHEVVMMRHGRLSLAPDLCWLDQWEFMALVGEIEALDDEASSSMERLEGTLEQLFELYRGPFMEGERPQVFRQPRERMRHALLRALDVLARQLERLGRAHRAPMLYRHAQEKDPVAEAFYRRHMLCLRGLGQHAQAVEVFGQLRSMLKACGLGEPSAETRAIYEAVLRGL